MFDFLNNWILLDDLDICCFLYLNSIDWFNKNLGDRWFGFRLLRFRNRDVINYLYDCCFGVISHYSCFWSFRSFIIYCVSLSERSFDFGNTCNFFSGKWLNRDIFIFLDLSNDISNCFRSKVLRWNSYGWSWLGLEDNWFRSLSLINDFDDISFGISDKLNFSDCLFLFSDYGIFFTS